MVAASELLAQATAELKENPRALRSLYAIVGAFVADAASTPTQYDALALTPACPHMPCPPGSAAAPDCLPSQRSWVYKELDDEVLGGADKAAAFYQPSLNPFYTRPLGANTCYGEQLLIQLRSMVEHVRPLVTTPFFSTTNRRIFSFFCGPTT